MSQISELLASSIISSADLEVARCTGPDGFDQSKFNPEFYFDAITDFIKSHAKIEGEYLGSIPGTGPDPLNGIKLFSLESVGPVVIPDLSEYLYPESADIWWNSLMSSLVITSKATEESGVTIIPFNGNPSTGGRSDISNLDNYGSKDKIWNKISDDIINKVNSIPFSVVNANSINGGIGTVTFNSVIWS